MADAPPPLWRQIAVAEFLISDYRMSIPGRVIRRERTQEECDANLAGLDAIIRTLRFMAENEDVIRRAIRVDRAGGAT